VLVREAVEDTGFDEPPLRFTRIVERRELEHDEHVVSVVHAAEDMLDGRLLAGVRVILVEERPPGVVVTDLDARDDERSQRLRDSSRPAAAVPVNGEAVRRKVVPGGGVSRRRATRARTNSWSMQNRPSVRVPQPGSAQILSSDISTSRLGDQESMAGPAKRRLRIRRRKL
jgi:hypothetical protein